MIKINIWNYIKSFKFQSLLIKNFILIFLCTSLPVIIITFSVKNKYNDAVIQEIETANYNSVLRMQETVDRAMQEATRLTAHISISNGYNIFFDSDDNYANYDNSIAIIHERTSGYINIYDYISSIYLHSMKLDKALYGNIDYLIGEVGMNDTTIVDENWYEEDIKNPQLINRYFSWQENREGENHRNYVTVVHYVRKKRTEILGSVTVNLKASYLAKMTNMPFVENDMSTLVIDNNTRQVIISQNSDDFLKDVKDIDIFSEIKYKDFEGSDIVTIDKIEYIVTVVDSKYLDWTYLAMLPLTSYSNDVNKINTYVKRNLLLSFILSLILSYMLTLKTYAPVRTIMRIIENPRLWDSKKKKNENEVKYISNNIFQIILSNETLEYELRNKISLLDKAQNKALQSQMNPHFLYNTLEAINWTTIDLTNGQNDASDMITQLSNMLRYSLDGEQFASLEDEVECCKTYIEIMKTRYKDRIEAEWLIQEDIKACKIMKLTLQPIIENAIYHGIKPKRMKGVIRISCELHRETLMIIVTDNGVGMSKDEVTKINNKINNKYLLKKEGIGMYNVNQRLKILYGDAYGIKVVSERNKGTSVTIKLPVDNLANT